MTPGVTPAESDRWTYGFCSCFGDCGECLYGCCCMPCAYGGLKQMEFNDSCFGNCLLMCCFGGCFCGLIQGILGSSNRDRIKATHGITEGDCGGGVLEWCCCPCLAVTQERREVKHRKIAAARALKTKAAADAAGLITTQPAPAMQSMHSAQSVHGLNIATAPYSHQTFSPAQMPPMGQPYYYGVPPAAAYPHGPHQPQMPPMNQSYYGNPPAAAYPNDPHQPQASMSFTKEPGTVSLPPQKYSSPQPPMPAPYNGPSAAPPPYHAPDQMYQQHQRSYSTSAAAPPPRPATTPSRKTSVS